MKRFSPFLPLLLVALLLPAVPVSSAPMPIQAVGTLAAPNLWADYFEKTGGHYNDVCSIWAARPDLLVTASHCVQVGYDPAKSERGSPFDYVFIATFYRGTAKIRMKARVAWDGYSGYARMNTDADRLDNRLTDVALLVPESPWPSVLPLASMLPKKGDEVDLLSFALGIRRWVGKGTVEGLFDLSGLGWMLLFRSHYGAPGASGSPVSKDGKAVGMHTHGYEPLNLSVAVPVGRIRQAIRDLDANGPMRP